MNVVDAFKAQVDAAPGRPAIIEASKEINYQDLLRDASKGAAYLKELGVSAGDNVLVFVPMSIDLYTILISLWKIGAQAVFIDPSAGAQHINQCCQIVDLKCFIGIPKAQLLRWWHKPLRRIPIAVSTGFSLFVHKWSQIKNKELFEAIHPSADEDVALITFTSGSTGRPKAAARTHQFLMAQLHVLQETLSLRAGDSDLATLPIFTLINLASGLTTILPDADLRSPGRINPDPVLEQIQRFKPNSAIASPAFFECLLRGEKATALANVQKLFTGGAPVFPSLLERLSAKMPESKVVAVYGSTEAEPIAEIAYTDIADADKEAMASGNGLLTGPAVDAIACRIIRDHWGTPLGALTQEEFHSLDCAKEEIGEIVVCGDHVLKGYVDGYGDEENKFKVDGVVWHRTGDLGKWDEQDRLWLLGRCTAKIEDEFGICCPFAIETAAQQSAHVQRAALCQIDGKRHLVIESQDSKSTIEKHLASLIEANHIHSIYLMNIPVDKRHNAKVDYTMLKQQLHKVNGR